MSLNIETYGDEILKIYYTCKTIDLNEFVGNLSTAKRCVSYKCLFYEAWQE